MKHLTDFLRDVILAAVLAACALSAKSSGDRFSVAFLTFLALVMLNGGLWRSR